MTGMGAGRRRAAGIVVAVGVTVGWTSTAHACGERRHSSVHAHAARGGALVIGDSTMILAAPLLARMGLETDAKGCRQFAEGLRIVATRQRAGTLPHLVVMALGANGPVSVDGLQRLLRVVGTRRVLALVTPRNQPASQAAIRAMARLRPDRILLMDWQRHGGGPALFAGDGLHPSNAGAVVYARFIAGRAAPIIRPPFRALRLPLHRFSSKDCGTVRRSGRRLDVRVVAGRERVTCARARRVAARPPLQGVRGWRWADWSTLPGPWIDVYRRGGRRFVVATVAASAG